MSAARPPADPRAIPAGRPTVVAVRAGSDLVRHGLVGLLRPYARRVRLGAPDETADVHVFDAWTAHGARRLVASGELERTNRPVVICPRDEPLVVQDLLRAGARGYLSPRLDGLALVEALERVHRGEVVVAATRTAERTSLGTKPPPPVHPAAEASGLSRREADVLVLVVQGLTNAEVAAATYLSPNTVKSYLRNAYRKIGATNRVEAVLWASAHGLLPDRG